MFILYFVCFFDGSMVILWVNEGEVTAAQEH